MKTFRSMIVQEVAIVLFIILVLSVGKGENTAANEHNVDLYDTGWQISTEDFWQQPEKLPEDIEIAEGGTLTLTRQLGASVEVSKCLSFFTSHQRVFVFVGDELVYQLTPDPVMQSKTPGNAWNFVELKTSYANQEICVMLENCYDSTTVNIPDFYYGSQDSVQVWYMREQIVSLMLSVITFLIGAVMVICYFSIRKTMGISESVLWLGMFAIPLAAWSMLECQLLQFFTSRTLLISQLTFMTLKLIPIPIIKFVSIIYDMRKDRILNGFAIASMLEFWITSAMQFLGFADYRETLWITHAICIGSALYVLFLTIRIFWEKGDRSRKSRRTIAVHALCVGTVACCVLLDSYFYYMGYSLDAAKFSRMGLLIYIVVLAIQLLDDSVQLIRAGQQARTLKVEVATDPMTKLYNRRAFEECLETLSMGNPQGYGIILCDLNDLKRVNDVYGHSMGDYYIIVCSEVLQDVLGAYGTVYRIGGDEFCAVVSRVDEPRMERLQAEVSRKIHSLTGTTVLQFMDVAMGFAAFDHRLDRNLSDTMERADASMYRQKKEMKGELSEETQADPKQQQDN